jgi:hypothetical protein
LKEKANRKYNAEIRLFISATVIFVLLLIDTVYCTAGLAFQLTGHTVAVKALDNWW